MQFINLDFIHTRICYGFLNESNHQEYLVLFARGGHCALVLEVT
jgi:hypothetical protein